MTSSGPQPIVYRGSVSPSPSLSCEEGGRYFTSSPTGHEDDILWTNLESQVPKNNPRRAHTRETDSLVGER